MLRAIGDERRQATVLNSLGVAYLRMGEPEQALEQLRDALALRRAVQDRRGEAVTLNNLGQVHARMERPALALELYRQALELRRAVDDRRGEAVTLDQVGTIHAGLGERGAAIDSFHRALELHRAVGDVRGEARTLRHLAGVRLGQDEPRTALRLLDEALELHRQVGDRVGEVGTLRGAARARRRLGETDTAAAHLDTALGIVEVLRGEIREADLRATFLAEERGAFEDKVDLLYQLHRRDPAAGKDREALEWAERARARSLLDVLDVVGSPIETFTTDTLQGLLDDTTLLVEYALGEERSFLWAATPRSFELFELPPRERIEAAARRLHEAWSALDLRGLESEQRTAVELAELVLGPLRPRLGATSRLVVVADGALHYVPFAALPMPGSPDTAPLALSHEVVGLPSASVLTVLRHKSAEMRGSQVAVMADPLYGDELQRLPVTRREAQAIAALMAPEDLLLFLGAEARRDAVIDGRLSSARIVHFAAHGVTDSRHPERSGLYLSLFDETGQPLDGFLSLEDVYGLRLTAEMVVLSGCRTALGREIRGEGLLGLTRGFLQAGASSVVASLWQVQDRATAELMSRFYRAMFDEGLKGAAALRQAQVEMWRDTVYKDPYHWAAFVVQGDWK